MPTLKLTKKYSTYPEYKDSGVDIDKANALVKDYKRFAGTTKIKGVMSDVGSFGALFRPNFRKFKDPILVSSTDGVGTKLKIAFLVDKHDTIGIDLVAMSANDIHSAPARKGYSSSTISLRVK